MTTLTGTRAADGALEIAIEASTIETTIDGRPATLLAYNQQVPGPTFVVDEGERVRIVLSNKLQEPTNLHVHGMPMPPAVDDPHRIAAPGETLVYEFVVPAGGAGTYWYHPHVHGEVAWQLGAGLAGAFLVRGAADRRAPLAGVVEHVLLLQDLGLEDGRPRPRSAMEMHDGREGEIILVGGARTPTIPIAGSVARVRLINGSGARFYALQVEGAEIVQLGVDGGFLGAPAAIEELLLPPGQRADLLLYAHGAGPVVLRQRPYRRGAFALPWARDRLPDGGLLATLQMTATAPAAAELPRLRPIERLDPGEACATRIFEYGGRGNLLRMVFEIVSRKRYGAGEGARGPVRFWLNGREFAPGRIDAEAVLGTMELWELRNPTALDHPFHLHIHAFQVLDVDGVPPPFVAWQDVVNVPAGKTVRILVPFRAFPGVTMFHCHILEHEDNGMMGHLRVIDPAVEPPPAEEAAREPVGGVACGRHDRRAKG